ncbi:unnamed protein product [Prorocentrum cordatum]|uniref:Uncharacterized protein n=1 Tax=Prorocentrum cordatum TaxID=2364126 RepID=A0ABN9SQF8_9DINO|nr:unnamed protein product [Polarella glacialis]
MGESIFSDAVQARVRSVFLFVLRVALLMGVASCPFVFFDWGTGLACAPLVLDMEPMPDPYHAARQAFPRQGEGEFLDLPLRTYEKEQRLESLVKLRSELEHELATASPGRIARTMLAEDIWRLAEDIREIEAMRPHGFDSG